MLKELHGGFLLMNVPYEVPHEVPYKLSFDKKISKWTVERILSLRNERSLYCPFFMRKYVQESIGGDKN